ncbi:MAG: hypothetical protein ABIZ64_06945, partial [Casimicrobium sp.]
MTGQLFREALHYHGLHHRIVTYRLRINIEPTPYATAISRKSWFCCGRYATSTCGLNNSLLTCTFTVGYTSVQILLCRSDKLMAPDSRLDRRQDQSIAAVYSAANGERTWEDALSQVMNCLSACGGQMVGINSSNGGINFSFASQKVVGDIELEYIRHYHQVDPRIPILRNRPLGQWLIDQDEFPPDVFDNNEYYRDLLAPEDCLYTATVRLYEDPHEMVLMAAVMPRDSAGFGLAQREYLRIIVPHLMEAVRLFRKTSKHAASDVAARKLIEHIKRPVVVIDDARAISMANLQGRTLLGRSEVLFEPDGHLVATRSDDEFALTCAIADLRRTMNTGTMGERALVRLRGGRRDSFAVSLIAFDPPTSMHAFGIRRQFMLSVHG